MDKLDPKKPESIPTDQAGPSRESASPKPPSLTEENRSSTGQEHPTTSESSEDSPPSIPSKKRKSQVSCFGQRSAKKAAKSSVKKQEPQEKKDLPKRERFRPSPLQITKSLEENPPPASPLKKLVTAVSHMSLAAVRNRLDIIKRSFTGEHPVKIYTRPSSFKLAEATQDGDDEPYVSPFFEIANGMTHNKMIGIHETQYFELSVRKIPKDKNIRKKLGICVKFINSRCTLPAEECLPCDIFCCQVCPHQFKCDCSEKFFDVEWCSHLHLAKRVELQKYRHQARLFISPTRNHLTADRHLRAFVQGATKMWEVAPELYEERFEFLMRSQPFKVTKMKNQQACECPKYNICKRCGACFCQWVCTCPDYWLYNQVCEHLHLVAMMRHPQSEELFETLGDYGEDDAFEYPLPDRGIEIEIEHENSFHINLKVDVVEMKGGGWRVASFCHHLRREHDKVVFIVTAESRTDLCVCGKPGKDTLSKFCERCGICAYHYRCTCKCFEQNFFCYHVHAVARKHQPGLEETVENRKKYLEDIVKRYDEILDINRYNKFNEREALGPLAGQEIAPELLNVSGETDFQADDGESDRVGLEAVKDDPAGEPMDESTATGPQVTIGESDKATPSEAVKDESTNDPAQEPMEESTATGPSRATIHESDEAARSEAVKDESDPSQEPMDK